MNRVAVECDNSIHLRAAVFSNNIDMLVDEPEVGQCVRVHLRSQKVKMKDKYLIVGLGLGLGYIFGITIMYTYLNTHTSALSPHIRSSPQHVEATHTLNKRQ